jgi:MFS family permease
MVAIMKWKGLEESTGGFLLGVMALLGMPASLIMGWLGDRYPKQYLMAIGDGSAATALALLLILDQVTIWHMLIVLVLWSVSHGNWPLSWAILAERFGRKNFGALRGGMIAMMSFLSFGAPLYSGWVFDRTESYLWALIPSIALQATAGLLVLFLPALSRRLAPSR